MAEHVALDLSDAEIARMFSDPATVANFPPVMTTRQAANLLQVRVDTVSAWHAKGELSTCARKRGRGIRILRDRLLKWYFNDGPGYVSQPLTEAPRKVHFGGVKVSLYQRRGIWWVRYRIGGKDYRYSLRTRDEVEANERVEIIATELKMQSVPSNHRHPTFDEAAKLYLGYLETDGRAKKTFSKYRRTLDNLCNFAATRNASRLEEFDLLLVDEYRRMRTKAGAAAKTLHNEITLLKQLVNFAIRRELLEKNPLKALKLKKPKPNTQPFWTYDQIEKILAAAAMDPYLPLFRLLAATGLRIGEAKHLAWDDIDFENRVLLVRPKQISQKAGDSWKPKTGDQRVVPLPPQVLEMLKSLPRRSRWVFGRPNQRRKAADTRPINDRNALAHLQAILKRLGFAGHLHTFRHSFISHALIRGVPEAVVRQWVGHVDAEILKHYTHIADRESQRYMSTLFTEDQQLQNSSETRVGSP